MCDIEKTVSVRELKASVLSTTLGNTPIVAGREASFTFTTTANEHAGINVLGTFEFSDRSAIKKLEYLEVQTGKWYEFYGDFGPAGTGFPMTNATSSFRVTFKKPGTYKVKVSMVKADDRTVLSSLEKEISVQDTCKLKTNIEEKTFVAGQAQEFTFTTVANGDAGTQVLGTFEFSDRSAIKKLEYLEVQTGKWYEFYGDFGPAGTGFPLTDATSRFRVTFQKHGEFKVTASVKAVDGGAVVGTVSADVKVEPAEQTGFHFTYSSPDDQWVGDQYTNEAVGGQTDGQIKYEVVSGPATIVDGATIAFTGLGKVTVKATRPGDDFYDKAEAYYSITSILIPWAPFTFSNSNPTIVYQPDLTYPNADHKNDLNMLDSAVTFAIVDGDKLVPGNEFATIDEKTGVLTVLKPGTVQVRATRNTDNYYLYAEANYTLTIEKAPQNISFQDGKENEELTFTTEAKKLPEVIGQMSREKLIYQITPKNSDVAVIDKNGELQLLKSGEFTLTVFAPGDAWYHESNLLRRVVTVKKAPQTGFGFEAETDVITYNDVDKNAADGIGVANEYTMITNGGQSAGSVSYDVVEGDAAYFDKDGKDGVLTIHKSGTVKVKATKASDDRYEEAVAYFELKIEKDDQSFTFTHDKNILKGYGLCEYPTQIVPSALNSGSIRYEASLNEIGATVDGNGLVSFAPSERKIGAVTITVTMVGDDCYNSYTDSYTITLDYEHPVVTYKLLGNKIIPTGEWFTGDVTILAPDGYEISYRNDLKHNEWKNAVIWEVDGQEGAWAEGAKPVVYLRNTKTGAITDAIFVSDLKKDTQKPNELAISYDATVWATIGEKLFGFSGFDVKVTVAAVDAMSGIAKMAYSTDGGDSYENIDAENGEYVFFVPADYRGQLWIKATDVAGHEEIYAHLGYSKELGKNVDQVLVIDTSAPGLTVWYDGVQEGVASEEIRYVSKEEIGVKFEITDDNFDLRGTNPIVTVNGEELTGWTYNETSGTLEFKLSEEGDYVIAAEFADRLGKKVTYQSEVRIDRTKPEITSDIVNGHYYTDGQLFTLTIKEHNFDAAKVKLDVSAKDSAGNGVLTNEAADAFKAYANNPSNWTHSDSGNEHTLVLDIHEDGNYTVQVDCDDKLGNPADTYSCEFTMDQTKPVLPTLKYETVTNETILGTLFGFSKEDVRVTVNTGDATSGVDYFAINLVPDGPSESTNITLPTKLQINPDGNVRSGDRGDVKNIAVEGTADNVTLTFDIPAQFRGVIEATVYDKAGLFRTTEANTEKRVIVVDNVEPKVQIEFAGVCQDQVKADNGDSISRETMETPDGSTRFIYNGAVTATIKVKEANFFHTIDMPITVIRDGEVVTDGFVDSGWSDTTTTDGYYVRTIVLQDDGDYRIEAEYQDHSENKMDWESNEPNHNGTRGQYVSNIHTVDTTKPVCQVTYDNNDCKQTLSGREYYAANRVATIQITDRNFRAKDVQFSVEAQNSAENTVEEFKWSNLTSWTDWERNGITWTAKVPFDVDANYQVTLSYQDLANNDMVLKENGDLKDYTKKFTVDKDAPTDLQVTYRPKTSNILNKVVNAITFGYFAVEQEVVLTMNDETAGIDYIKLTVTPEGPVCATNLEMPENLVINADGSIKSGKNGFIQKQDLKSTQQDGNVTMTFTVPAQFRGKVSFEAYDKSGNHSNSHKDPGVLVVDTIKPECTVSYNPSNVVMSEGMTDMTGFDATAGITDSGADYVMYFSADAVATIEIDEANFDPTQVQIAVLNGNGMAVQGWRQSDWITTVREGKADRHTTTVTIPGEGDYYLKVSYQDYSENTPVDYTSQRIVVDKTAPVINVEYANTDIKNSFDNRDYFAEAQKATIAIKDHNFRADDVVIKVTAKNVVGADVLNINGDGTVTAYAEQGANRANWTAYEAGTWRVKDDTFIITLNYTADANYTFDIEYQDLAKNKAADYEQDLFTVDTTAPENLTVSYSTSFFEQVKQSITFGYYNARMTVTITAEDETSGITRFVYSYIKGKNVSGINAQLLDQAISEAEIKYQGKKATATFHIPKMVLGNDNQFNGTVEFNAYDRSEKETLLKDSKVIIVDNISPTSKISYNAPVQTANGTSYYDGDINATIVINEANFDAKDVVVTVTRNGKAYPVNVAWHDNSTDTHTGSFVLKEDGDYIVSVQYKDKSGNQMASYTSNKLTRDTVKPTIKVSNIKANSANKDEKYGFVITVDDINLDASTIKPVLKTVLKQEDGKYTTVEIDLGQATTVVKGKTYTYTVEDLPEDGLYTLTCEVKDMSANTMSQIILDDGQSYEQVQFSINRKGSVFAYGNEFTSGLVEQYYIYSVEEDLVIVEVNVDPIEQYKVTLNGNDLVEGTDFTTAQTSKNGEWSKRTYTVKKELFAKEGEYNVIVSSTDKASTTAFSDVKDLSMAFVVDQTKPVLVITGLENGGRYRTKAQTVTLIPTDEGGRLNSLSVVVLASDGTPLKDKETNEDISVRFKMSGDELLKHLEENDGKITFTIPNGLNHKVQITCNDCAQHNDDTTNEYAELFNRVTVSDNGFVILFANTYVFAGLIAGLLALIALLIVLITKSKKKKK